MRTCSLVISLVGLLSCAPSLQEEAHAPELQFETYFDGSFHLPKGWKSTLWAESPQLFNPTNMDVDTKGRIWVTEAVNYRDFNNTPDRNKHFPQGDRIVILEDTDGDGRCDHSKVFVQDTLLRAPVGLAVIGQQVIVSCSPNLIVYTDEDGDDRPDKREILLTGFGGYDHDHSLHALVAGPDGRWYFNTGNAGPHLVTDRSGWTLRSGSLYTGGTPYNLQNQGNQKSDDGRVWVGGLALSMNPDGTGLKVMGHNFRNSYEIALDSYGNMWQNDNDDQTVTCRATWLMEGGNAGFFSTDGTRSWQADQRPWLSVFANHWHQEDPGVMPAGDNTGAGSPTGVLMYEGHAFGPTYRGMFLSVEAGRNVIYAYQPKMKGAGYILDRKELISTIGPTAEEYIWHEVDGDERKRFRPSDAVVGTDGSIYIADWYDPIVGGHQMQDSVGYGRIFRITPEGKRRTPPVIDLSTTDGQLAALFNPAVNVRHLGFIHLKNQGEAVLPRLMGILSKGDPWNSARTIFLMAHLGEKGLYEVKKVLTGAVNPNLRIAAYRALKADTNRLLEYAGIAAVDPSAAVRREVAISLRDVPLEACKAIVQQLIAGFDGTDRWYLQSLGMALDGEEEEAYVMLVADQPADPTLWSPAFAALVWQLHPKAAIDALKLRAMSAALSKAQRSRAIDALAFIRDRKAAEAMIDLSLTAAEDVRMQAAWWRDFRKTNLWRDLLPWEDPATIVPKQLPKAVIAAQESVLNDELPPGGRLQAAQTLAEHPAGGLLLVSLAARQQLPDFLLNHKQLSSTLFNHSDPQTRIIASSYFQPPADQALTIEEVAKLRGNPERGRELFAEKCATCHKTGNRGPDIGPSLWSIGDKFEKRGLIDAILHPSASITFGYEATLIKTKDEQTYYGRMLSDGEVAVIQDISGKKHVIDAGDIAGRTVSATSLMPPPAGLELDAQGVADIVTFLSR